MLKRHLAPVLAFLLAGPASATDVTSTGTGADGYTVIGDEATFRDLVVGRQLWLGDNHVTIRADGKMTGVVMGKQLSADWIWDDGYWCRSIAGDYNAEDCQLWETDGASFRVTREKGEGRSFAYTLAPD